MAGVGIASVLTLAVGCTSTSPGKPAAANTGAHTAVATSTASAATAPSSLSVPTSLPTGLPTSLPTALASLSASAPLFRGSKFCTDYSSQGSLSDILSGAGDDLDAYLKGWDKMVAEAPAEIKSDVESVRDYLRGAVKGQPDPDAAQKLASAYSNMLSYIIAHCH
jgi:hypothetical protein